MKHKSRMRIKISNHTNLKKWLLETMLHYNAIQRFYLLLILLLSYAFFVLRCISAINKASNPIICGKNIRIWLGKTSSSFSSKSNVHVLFFGDTKLKVVLLEIFHIAWDKIYNGKKKKRNRLQYKFFIHLGRWDLSIKNLKYI